MFNKHNDVYMDLSIDMRDPDDWNVGTLRLFDYPLNITALATEPISRLLAVGTALGIVHIFGGPGVETTLKLPEPVGVKFVHFATSSFKLVCMDINNLLHIWDLSSYGQPKFLISVRFDPTNFLTLSPSHDHVRVQVEALLQAHQYQYHLHQLFISLISGEIRTYDLACLRKSPYTIPNMWKLYERESFTGGAPDLSTPESCTIVETVGHPRDLNLLFVAYSGGVVLSDLTKRNTVGAFALILPPGAPGGLGYGDRDLLSHRKPPVTAMAIHPSGHFFVVGHADGSLAFWAVEDDDRPLLVRTLDETDVNILNTEILDEHISQERASKRSFQTDREPIFKLSWSAVSDSSDPRGGETALTIFGGLHTNQATGISIYLFPAFNPRDPPQPMSDQKLLHPHMRAAMRDSLDHSKTFFYYTRGIVQDYLLIPRVNPHFAGASDPIAILLLTEGTGDSRVVEAFQYPPPEFSILTNTDGDYHGSDKDPMDAIGDDLASTLRSLQMSDEPKRLQLPTALMNGSTGLLNGQLLKVETDTYQTLADGNVNDVLYLPLEGGLAWADDTKKTELKLSKHQPHRLVITYNLDLTIRFYDISAQLLDGLKPTPIKNNFPNPLPALTIDLKLLFMDSFVSKRTSPTILDDTRIDSVLLAQESQEVVVALQTGEVVVYRLSSPRTAMSFREAPNELLLLEHVPPQPGGRFSPYFMLMPGAGPVEACAISDLGFLAVTYSDGSLYVVDIRGPHIILRHSRNTSKKSKYTVGLHLGRSESSRHIGSLVWTVSSLEEDNHSRIRLIALYTSGLCDIYTVTQSNGSALWTCEGPISAEGVANPLPQGSFIIDCKSGNKWKASRARLNESTHSPISAPSCCAFVTCGSKGARCFININGQQIARTDWGGKIGAIQGAQIVERLGSHVLVVFTDRHHAAVYSLPHLELLHTLSLPAVTSMPLSIDETGDFMAWIPHPPSGIICQAAYGTLFDIRRTSGLPNIDFLCTKPIIPAQPQPVSMAPPSLLSSWFPFSQSMTGDQLDTMLGGPDRPLPRSERQPQSSTGTSSVATAATAATTQSTNLYNRLAATLNERGQLLGDLEDRFNALEEGSKSMVAQAKRLATQHAAKQTAKSWF